jgi:hypothetical protein
MQRTRRSVVGGLVAAAMGGTAARAGGGDNGARGVPGALQAPVVHYQAWDVEDTDDDFSTACQDMEGEGFRLVGAPHPLPGGGYRAIFRRQFGADGEPPKRLPLASGGAGEPVEATIAHRRR